MKLSFRQLCFCSTLLLLLLLLACTPKKDMDDLPIPLEKMVKVMTDAYIAEAAIQNYTPEIKDSFSTLYYDQIYQIHQITKEQLDESLEIMEHYPEMMDTLYARIGNHLLELEK